MFGGIRFSAPDSKNLIKRLKGEVRALNEEHTSSPPQMDPQCAGRNLVAHGQRLSHAFDDLHRQSQDSLDELDSSLRKAMRDIDVLIDAERGNVSLLKRLEALL